MTLGELLKDIKKVLDERGESALSLPVYSVHTASGELCEDVSIGVNEITESDLDMSSLGEGDLGTEYIALYLD